MCFVFSLHARCYGRTFAVRVAPAYGSQRSKRMYQVPRAGLVITQSSSLPPLNDAQVKLALVGGVPRRRYRSTSPVPPRIVTLRLVAPSGTKMRYITPLPRAALLL